jgi:hypothetical protein
MIGIRRARVVCGVTSIASAIDELVVAIRMAGLALHCSVSARQGEFRRGMVEGCRLPGRGGMTGLTSLTEVSRHVVRVRRSCKICRVALVAIRIDQLIVAICMARLARRRQMGASQRKFRRAVIKRCRLPRCGGVTSLTVLAEVPCNVVRVRRSCKICRVTLIAIRVDELIVVVRVTRLALHGGVSSGQCKLR